MTHRQSVLALLKDYEPVDPAEVTSRQEIIDFVNTEPDCFQRSLLKGHVTGSALLINKAGDQVLLNHHKKLDKWLSFGGHADGDSDIFAVAQREAQEESGIKDIEPVTAEIFDVDVHRIPARPEKGEPAHNHYDIAWLFQTNSTDDFTVSPESQDLQWVDNAVASNMDLDDRMRRMLGKWRARLK